MKKLLLSSLFLVFALISFNSKAGTISIDSTDAYHYGPCNVFDSAYFSASGFSKGYTLGDTIKAYFNFGDGISDTVRTQIRDTSGFFYLYTQHSYANSGIYSIQYIVVGPDLAADTVVRINAVNISDSCGNIKGRVYNDYNSNCSFDGNDFGTRGIRVNAIQNNQIVTSTWTNDSGFYSLSVPVNQTYTIELQQYSGYSISCPTSGKYTVSSFPSLGKDFAISCTNAFDLKGNFWGRSIPGQTINSYLYIYNSFCMPKSGTVKLIFEDSLFSYDPTATPAPISVSGDTVEWSFTNLTYLNSTGFTIPTYTDTTAQIGDTVCVKIIISPQVGDSVPGNNVREICFPVRSSYDPNEKNVQPIGIGNTGRIKSNTDLTYTINFQNTGNSQAYNIYIMDTLDNSVLDPSTIEILGSSHKMVVNLSSTSNNVIRFRFDDINLADSNSNEPASHGWLTYTIKQQANLINGQKIENSAAIYFDYNPAVITNSTLNTIDNTLVGIKPMGKVESNFAKFYPNPTTDVFNIEFDGNETATYELNLYNINGQLLRQMKTNKKVQQMNVSNLETGIYLLEVRDENGQRQMNKIVVGR